MSRSARAVCVFALLGACDGEGALPGPVEDDASGIHDASQPSDRDGGQADAELATDARIAEASPTDVAMNDGAAEPPALGHCEGNFVLTTAAELAEVVGCTSIDNLEILGTAFEEVELPNLARVGGLGVTNVGGDDLYRGGILTRVSLPVLEEARSITFLVAPSLVVFEVPRLRIVTDNIRHDTTGIREFAFPSLESLAGGIDIYNPDALEALDLPSLVHGYRVGIHGAKLLTRVSVPLLETCVGGLTVDGTELLVAFSAPRLARVDLDNFFGRIDFSENATLSRIDFPALVSVAGTLFFRNNPQLPSCAAEELAMRLQKTGAQARIEGNDESTPCP